MFIKVKVQGNEVNVNVNSIRTFTPNKDADGSIINIDGGLLVVEQSCRTLRHLSKKAHAEYAAAAQAAVTAE